MNGYDLYDELNQKRRQLDVCIRELRKSGTAYAEAERAYKVKLRETCLKLRSQDMAIGMIQLTCYGVPEVADLRFQRDVAETVWLANKEAVQSIKLQLRLIEGQINREYGSPTAGTGSM
jgi:hypothetical protein